MDKRYRLIIDNDGGDTFYCAGPTYAQFTASRMQGLCGSGATTLFYTPVSSGFSVFTHHTRIGSIRTLHEARHPRNITAELLAQGTDCMRYALRFCREQGMELFFGMRMNDTHDGTGAPYSEAMLAGNRFKLEHPDCLLGTRENPPRHGAWTAVNYLCAPVRDMAYALIEEVCQNYDVDGIYLDFFRHPVFFPNPAKGAPAAREELAAMTDLLRRVHCLLRAEAQRRGRPLPLAIRVPDSVPYARFLGLDLEAWLAEGLVDLLLTASYLHLNPWEVSAALGHAAGIPVYASLDEPRIRDAEANRLRTEPPGMYARCANALAAGCDGVMLFNYIFDGAKNVEERYALIRGVARPERLRRAPKRYFASFLGLGAVAGGAPDHAAYQTLPVLNPAQPLSIEGEAELDIRVGDPSMDAGQVLLWLDAPVPFTLWLNGTPLGQAKGPQAALPIPAPLQGDNRLRIRPEAPVRLLDAAVEAYKQGVSGMEHSTVKVLTKSRRAATLKTIRQMRLLYVFLLFPAAFLIVFNYAPMYGVIIAFKKFRYADGIMGSAYNSFAHFKMLSRDILFQRAFFNTLRISLTRIFVTFPMPILFALMLNEVRGKHFKRVTQTISYLPHFMSWVIIASFVRQLLSQEYGTINILLGYLGIQPVFFMGSKRMFLPILIIAQLWQSVGWGSIIYLAAMSAVNPELYESADLDGANRLHKALHITLPSIAPIIVIQFILRFSSIMQGGFDPIFNLYNALTMEVADVIDTYSFRAGLLNAKYDYAAAIGLFQNAIGLVMVLFVNGITKRISEYAIW